MSKIFKSEGIIFRTIKYAETSIITDIYTKEKGLKSFIISGARSAATSKKAIILKPCNHVDIIAYESDTEKLSRIKEIHFSIYFQNINYDVLTSCVAIFMVETCRNAIKEKEPNAEMYDFLRDWFLFLDDTRNYSNLIHLKFLLEFSYFLGFGPLHNYAQHLPCFDKMEGCFCKNIGNYSTYLLPEDISICIAQLLDTDKDSLSKLKISKDLRFKITEELLHFYAIHISGFKNMQSLSVLRSVLS